MSEKRKCRQYSTEYLKYGFISASHNEQLPLCLLCEKTFSNEAMKPSRMLEHLKRIHPDKVEKNLDYFRQIKNNFNNRPSLKGLINKNTNTLEKGLVTSYKLSKLIAKCGKPHNIGETLLLPAFNILLDDMIGQGKSAITASIPLSNSTVASRIDEMANDVEIKLCDALKNAEFALQLDESTLRDNESLLMGYVRYVSSKREIIEEFLFAEKLVSDTKGSSIFKVVKYFFNAKNIPLANIIACATDGAPAMIGRHRGFIAHLKEAVPHVFTIHCVIHREHLAAKHLSGRLHNTLNDVIKAVNKIKAHSLNDRIFRQLCHENDEKFERLLLHTEVRWLSKGNCLKRFNDLYETILEFLNSCDENMCKKLRNERVDIAYLSNIFEKLNEVNIKLQGSNMNLIKAKGIINAFISKLSIFKERLSRKDFTQFTSLKLIEDLILDTDIDCYCSHLQKLKEDFEVRFQDFNDLKIPDWVINPFLSDVSSAQTSLREEIIDLQNDVEAQVHFQQLGYEVFWPKMQTKYFQLWKEIKLLFIAFPSSYLVEKGFSQVSELLTKQRNKLNISKRGDLRLRMTSIEPDIENLSKSHQAQGSH